MRILVGLALAVAVAAPAAVALRPTPEPPVPVAALSVDGRLRYPAGRYPLLMLPNGERRAVRSLLDVRRPLAFGDYAWNDRGVPAGPVWVRVDLARQTLSVFRAGHEIGATLILYGADGKPTPPGVYPVLERAREHRSTLYDAEMPFMLRLTGDGIAIHASNVRWAAATHGCIGVPLAFARLLFAQVKRGDPVAIVGTAPAAGPDKNS